MGPTRQLPAVRTLHNSDSIVSYHRLSGQYFLCEERFGRSGISAILVQSGFSPSKLG